MLTRLLFFVALINISLSSVLYRDEYGNLVRYEGRNDQLNVYQRPNQQQPSDTYYRQNRAPSPNDYYRRKQLDDFFKQLERNADNRLPHRQQGWGDARKNPEETVELGKPLTNKDVSKSKDNAEKAKVVIPEDSLKAKKAETVSKDSNKPSPNLSKKLKVEDHAVEKKINKAVPEKKKDAVQKKVGKEKYVDSLFDDEDLVEEKKETTNKDEVKKTVSKDEVKKTISKDEVKKTVSKDEVKKTISKDEVKSSTKDETKKSSKDAPKAPEDKKEVESDVPKKVQLKVADPKKSSNLKIIKLNDSDKFKKIDHLFKDLFKKDELPSTKDSARPTRYDNLIPKKSDGKLSDHQQKLYDEYRRMLDERFNRLNQRDQAMRAQRYDNRRPVYSDPRRQQQYKQIRQRLSQQYDTPHNRLLFNNRFNDYQRHQDDVRRYDLDQRRRSLIEDYRKRLTNDFQQQMNHHDYPRQQERRWGDAPARHNPLYIPQQGQERNYRFDTVQRRPKYI
ncbi:probable inactive protein kinase DDB_G0270444 [Clytia hemisphaerica]|uniref:Uncharacterized protein n=1 Tax=Clytia hemisphaerica TaxID=252671 RepID=A0A7M5XEN1_9CNID